MSAIPSKAAEKSERDRTDRVPLAVRAARRERDLREAQAAYDADPSDENQRALVAARRAHSNGMTREEHAVRVRRMIEIVTEQPMPTRAVELFAKEYDITERKAWDWLRFALTENAPDVQAMRAWAVLRLQKLAGDAAASGDYKAATLATTQAAKFSGVHDKQEATLTHELGESFLPSHLLALVQEGTEGEVVAFLREGRLPPRDLGLNLPDGVNPTRLPEAKPFAWPKVTAPAERRAAPPAPEPPVVHEAELVGPAPAGDVVVTARRWRNVLSARGGCRGLLSILGVYLRGMPLHDVLISGINREITHHAVSMRFAAEAPRAWLAALEKPGPVEIAP